MTPTDHARKARAIARVRDYFPDAQLLISPPGAVIVESLVTMAPFWRHDTARHGPPHLAWVRMARSMAWHGLV